MMKLLVCAILIVASAGCQTKKVQPKQWKPGQYEKMYPPPPPITQPHKQEMIT